MKKIYLLIVFSITSLMMQAQCLVTATSTGVSCNGDTDGTATAIPLGFPPYNYQWMPGGMTTQTVTNLAPGTYTVTVVDGTSCTASFTVTITEPDPLSATSTVTNVSCNGACDGSATAFVAGGTSPYTHVWSDPSPSQTNATATGLCPGVYYDTITDANGCMTTLSPGATITEPAVLSVSLSCQSVHCFGGADGSSTATATGGTADYDYAWSTIPVQTTQTATNLPAGTYTVTVTDDNGCTATESCTVNQPSAALEVTATGTDASTSSSCDGIATTSVTGGTTAYSYAWAPGGQTTANIVNLCPGNYTVCVTDANGCETCDSLSINYSVGIAEQLAEDGVSYYPNPTSGEFELQLALPGSSTKILFSIIDVVGKTVYSESITATGSFKKKFSLQSMPSGIYFLQTIIAGKSSTHKIVKN